MGARALAALSAVLWLSGCAALGPIGPVGGHMAYVGPDGAKVGLHYTDVGSGPPLLLIHGFGTNAYSWHRIIPALSQTHRVIAIDMKGFGHSEKPMDDEYSAADQAALLADFIRLRDLRNLTLIGHSFGGGVALLLALENGTKLQGRIARMVLIDTLAYAQDIPVFLRMLRAAPALASLGMRLVPPEVQTSTALRLAFYDDRKITRQDVVEYALPFYDAGGRHALIATAKHILPDDLPAISRRYGTIKMPVEILWCREDPIVPMRIGARLFGALPNAEFRLIEACGHLPQEEQPARTVRLIQEFLLD